MTAPNTADVRARHYENPTAVKVNGEPVPACQFCWTPYPCDAIRLADALDERDAEIERLQAEASFWANR